MTKLVDPQQISDPSSDHERFKNSQWVIMFRPLQVAKPIHATFLSFITNFDDRWSTNFNSETVYGRMDPIYTFQNTQRNISLGFSVPSASLEEGYTNMVEFEKLISFLYPAYETRNGQRILSSPPIMRVKFGNLIKSGRYNNLSAYNEDEAFNVDVGLMVAVNGFSMNPNIDMGFYTPHRGKFIPKEFSIDCELSVVHEHMLGWKHDTGEWFGGAYPYGIGNGGEGTQFPAQTHAENILRKDENTSRSPGPSKDTDSAGPDPEDAPDPNNQSIDPNSEDFSSHQSITAADVKQKELEAEAALQAEYLDSVEGGYSLDYPDGGDY